MPDPEAHLGTYRLIGRLGAGGMGEVWKAEDTRLGRTVAIKILPPALVADQDAMNRMRREARTAAQIYHPNIATIHSIEEVRSVSAEGGDGQSNARLFIVMEFVEGEPLTNLIRRGPLAEGEVCRIGRSIADALAEAHGKEIVHRDIKPDNVIVNGAKVKVLDFGIAKRVGPEAIGANDPTAFRTQTGFIIGTVNYMSPEQALGRPVDARTDIFSLGVVLYEAATGRLPFRGESITETITLIARDEPEPLRGVSPRLEAIIRKCLAKRPEDRFATARDVAAALEGGGSATAFKAPAAEPARSRWPMIAAVSTVLITGVLSAIVLLRPRTPVVAEPPKITASSAAAITTTIEVAAAAEPTVEYLPPITTTTAVVIEPANKSETNEKSAEDFYNEGLARLVERQPFQAREAFESAVELDPEHAKAHFRLGEMALFGRDFPEARIELQKALANSDRLEVRERKLTELGLAVLDRDRERAQTIIEEIAVISPRDPDLMRFRKLLDGPGRGRRVQPH